MSQRPGNVAAHQYFTHPQHLSTTSHSSGATSSRSSNNSTFSHLSGRDSISSSTSGWSHTTDLSRDHHVWQAEHTLTQNSSAHLLYAPNPDTNTIAPATRTRAAQRQYALEKDYFKTCVSTHKQTRPCLKEQKYFCTVCKKPFVEKADWKRHEETYQERSEKFQCDLCSAIYFLDKDFVTHHAQSHRCASCTENIKCSRKRHVWDVRQKRPTRTGWGCGYCCHFSTNWIERCNHIARHIDDEGKSASNWKHSQVIYSLLQRPALQIEWIRLLSSKPEHMIQFAWNEHSTGRVEGYPESHPNPKLQDMLEYYTPNQNAALLVRLAYDKMVKQTALPKISAAPPVPQKDPQISFMEELTRETESWTQFMNTIVADDTFPTDVCDVTSWYEE